MIRFIKMNRKNILQSLLLAIVITYILSFSRSYKAFGGEDLLPIGVLFYWLFKFIEEKENAK